MFKRTVNLLVAICILLMAHVIPVSSESPYNLGDVNKDGEIDQYDYLLVKRCYFGTLELDSSQMILADVNMDGEVDQYDYLLLKRHYFGTYVIRGDETVYEPDDPITPPESETYTNIVSNGKQYTVNRQTGESYPDSYDSELTDGVSNVSTSYFSNSFSGYITDFSVTVDLDDDGKALNRFELSYLSTSEAGINIPASVKVYASNDNNSWNFLGAMTVPAFYEGKVMVAYLEVVNAVDYRYIRYDIVRTTTWVFVDEITIYSEQARLIQSKYQQIINAYANDTVTDSEMTNNINSVSTGILFNKNKGTSAVSVGCDYLLDCSGFDWRTGNKESVLTDGASTETALESGSWLGIDAENGVEITVDLGEVRSDIYGFTAHCFNRETTGIVLPDYVDISVSKNGTDFVKIGRSYAAVSEQENYVFRVLLSELIKARYVRFTFPEENGCYWIEEIEVLANSNEQQDNATLYGSFDFVTTAEPSYWDKTDDYNKEQNLILNLYPQILSDSYLEYANYCDSNTPETSSILTDGKTTNDNYCYNGLWHHFHVGNGRSLYFDLGNISAVSGFSARMLVNEDWAIYAPDVIRLALSENGTDWYLAGEIYPSDGEIVYASKTLGSSYRARYAMLWFDVNCHVFMDEIQIIGKKNVSGAVSLTELEVYQNTSNDSDYYGYMKPSEDILGGVEDVALIYHNIVDIDEDHLLPYVAYLDKDGNITDTMFDGFLFLPSTAELPSGGRPYGTNYASDWNYLFDDLFASGKNFDALDKTAQKVKNALNKTDYKLKVFVTIPHMDDSLYEFGDIDFDGNNDSLTTLDNRVYVAKCYAERVIKAFNAAGYENLELCGFYWFHEEIRDGDVETARAVNAMFDEIGYQLFWIPYYQASGYSNWYDLGFDVACYQPNYAFSLSVSEPRLSSASDAAKRYGMCIEIEIDGAALSDTRYFQKYMDYLSGGIKYGYIDDCIHMYYQGIGYFGNACRSDDAKIRLIYDYTYQFIKGTLENEPDTVNGISCSTEINESYYGTLNRDNSETVKYMLSSSPKHGTVTISENGEYVYLPNKNFTGTDVFSYQISNYLGWSEECFVSITVGEDNE